MCLFEKYNVRKYESQLPTVESSCSPCYKGLFISLLKLQLLQLKMNKNSKAYGKLFK